MVINLFQQRLTTLKLNFSRVFPVLLLHEQVSQQFQLFQSPRYAGATCTALAAQPAADFPGLVDHRMNINQLSFYSNRVIPMEKDILLYYLPI